MVKHREAGMAELTPKERCVLEAFEKKGHAGISEIYKTIGSNTTIQSFYKVVRRLEAKGYIRHTDYRIGLNGRPEKVYAYIGRPAQKQLPLFEVHHRDEVELGYTKDPKRADTYAETYVKPHEDVFEQLGKTTVELLPDPEELRRIFRQAALLLKREDPMDLYLRFCTWIKDEIEKAAKKYWQLKLKEDHKGADDIAGRIRDLETLCEKIFHRYFGVPRFKAGFQEGPLRLKDIKEELIDAFKENPDVDIDSVLRSIIKFDPEGIRAHLKPRIYGKTVIEEIPIVSPSNEEGNGRKVRFIEAGTDVSYFDVHPPLPPGPSLLEPLPIKIMTALYVLYDLIPRMHLGYDASPEPREWGFYGTDKALNEGWLIPPWTLLDIPDARHKRLIEAAADLRQYIKDKEAMDAEINGKGADVIFRDGRLFPMEHQLDDVILTDDHGRLVRAALKKFRDIVATTAVPGTPRYCGIVKIPQVSIFAPLVMWYFKYGCRLINDGKSLWKDMDDTLILRPMASDQRVTLFLLTSLDPADSHTYRATFRAVRPFYTLYEDFPAVYFGRDQQKWFEHFTKELSRPGKDKYYQPEDLELYAWLCAKVGLLTFFAVPGDKHYSDELQQKLLIPRYEILVPYTKLDDAELAHAETDYIKSVLFYLSVASEPYIDVDIYGKGGNERGPILILPSAVCRAHEWAKELGRLHKGEVENAVFKIIRRILEEKRKGSRS